MAEPEDTRFNILDDRYKGMGYEVFDDFTDWHINVGLRDRLCDIDELVLVGWDHVLAMFDFSQTIRLLELWVHASRQAKSFAECTEWFLIDMRQVMEEVEYEQDFKFRDFIALNSDHSYEEPHKSPETDDSDSRGRIVSKNDSNETSKKDAKEPLVESEVKHQSSDQQNTEALESVIPIV